jgi:hypothetical protein
MGDAVTERSNIVYGRLLESVHISNYSTDRACDELEYLLEENRWKAVGKGYDDISEFARSLNPKDEQLRFARDRRKKLAGLLDKLGASQRATAKALGVDRATVQRDIGAKTEHGAHAPPKPRKSFQQPPASPSTGAIAPPARQPFD